MFNPCYDQTYNGINHACHGSCWDCKFHLANGEIDALNRKVNEMGARITTELEPRLKQERRSYDAWVTSREELEDDV